MNIAEAQDILDSLLDIKRSQVLCDVTFVVGSNKERISSHKIVLAARSAVFKTMFTGRWATGDEIQLPDVDPHVFHIFLEYLYAGKSSKRSDEIDVLDMEMLIYLADYYDVSSLSMEFQEMLQRKFAAHNILEIHNAADRFNLAGLRHRAAKFMIRKLSELMLEPSFELMNAKLLEMCVIERGAEVSEIDVFIGLMKWSEARCKEAAIEISGENKRNMLGDIFTHIQFGRIRIEDFEKFVVPSNILTAEEELIVAEDITSSGIQRSSQALDSDVPWTRGSMRNETQSRRRSALLRQYNKSHLEANKFKI